MGKRDGDEIPRSVVGVAYQGYEKVGKISRSVSRSFDNINGKVFALVGIGEPQLNKVNKGT
ncbi:MAG: hypothetical protein LBI61_01200 [Puniceicoccales bacterium]|nr:hypothetical protein [Puniceicoccales bacterium]